MARQEPPPPQSLCCHYTHGAKGTATGIIATTMPSAAAADLPTSSEPIEVRLHGLCKAFGRRRVIKDIQVSVCSGATLAIAGPNGSGKSTLIKMIGGLLHPDAGSADVVRGRVRLDPRERRRLIGWVAPEIGLYPSLTGPEHLALFGRLRGIRLSVNDARGLMTDVGLRARLRDPVRTYSSGMKQRLRFACAILHQPPLLLLDEPFATLDAEGVGIVREIVRRQRECGITVVAGNDDRELQMGDTRLVLGVN